MEFMFAIYVCNQVKKTISQNTIISCLNITSIQNKLNDLKFSISDSVDILCIAESKLDELYLNGEITLEGFEKPYRLDVTAFNGGFLIYIKASLPPKVN